MDSGWATVLFCGAGLVPAAAAAMSPAWPDVPLGVSTPPVPRDGPTPPAAPRASLAAPPDAAARAACGDIPPPPPTAV